MLADMRFLKTVLIGLCAAAIVGAIPVPASAASLPPGITCSSLQPFLLTGYGPVRLCYRHANYPYGWSGMMGYYSGVNGTFDPITGWLDGVCDCQHSSWPVTATDGFRFEADLSAVLSTAYGQASWGVQYRDSWPYNQGRFGVYNHDLDRFYPSSGWLSVVH